MWILRVFAKDMDPHGTTGDVPDPWGNLPGAFSCFLS